ncbi:hypothetical protein, partial [Coleofasciculus sp.]
TLTHCKLYGSDRVAVAPDSRPLKSAIINAFRSCPSTYRTNRYYGILTYSETPELSYKPFVQFYS